MKVILLERIGQNSIGEIIDVKAGYARNYLLPYQKALAATAANMAVFEGQKAELEKREQERLEAARKQAEEFKVDAVSLTVPATDDGKLYGSIASREIVDAILRAGGNADKAQIEMPDGSIREVGEYEVMLRLHADVAVPIKVSVSAEQA